MIPESTEPILQYVMKLYAGHAGRSLARPLVVGLTGPLGSGKSTIVSQIVMRLRQRNIKAVAFSLDDVYLTHSEQVALAQTSQNQLLAHRGLPGTHDIELCRTVLESLIEQQPVRVPIYDKFAFDGQGDRSSESVAVEPPYHVVLLEGWCVGFRSLSEDQAYDYWWYSLRYCDMDCTGILGMHSFEDVCYVNKLLRAYDAIWDKLDALIQLEAEEDIYDTDNCWRLQVDRDLIKWRSGNSKFKDPFTAAYDLYLDSLLHCTLTIRLDKHRHVVKVLPQLDPPSRIVEG